MLPELPYALDHSSAVLLPSRLLQRSATPFPARGPEFPQGILWRVPVPAPCPRQARSTPRAYVQLRIGMHITNVSTHPKQGSALRRWTWTPCSAAHAGA
eukprot:694944-Rhodomonas_salina.9